MLPERLRLKLFDRLSKQTMRYVTAVPWRGAKGLTRRTYEMIEDDFFMNGSLTSRSRVPELMAAIWTAGRETMLVDDQLDRTRKEAICAVLSDLNDCPYCGDMLVSLVHAGDRHDEANAVLDSRLGTIEDPILREQLSWVEAVGTPGRTDIPELPFSPEAIPEVLGSLMSMADINRFSHVVMDGSPVNLPGRFQSWGLRWFGGELRSTKRRPAEPGRALDLLEPASLPDDLAWAAPNPRIADALARWAATVERVTAPAVPREVRTCVEENLAAWDHEPMPISRGWVEDEVRHLREEHRAPARLALVLAKAPYQVDESLVEPLITGDEAKFVKFLGWASFVASRRFAGIVADRIEASLGVSGAVGSAAA